MSILPEYLELAQLLSSPTHYDTVLPRLTTSTLESILPYLNLPTLIKLSRTSSIDTSNLIDLQRDWCLSNECPDNLKDGYLVDLFDEGRKEMFQVLKDVPNGSEYLLKADTKEDQGGGMCNSFEEFEKNFEKMSNGIFKNLDWNNVVLGGGSVLACLTNQVDSPEFVESDFDLFLYGLSPSELIPKINSIITQISSTLPPPPPLGEDDVQDNAFYWEMQHRGELLILKGFNALTLLPPIDKTQTSARPRRATQIVLNKNSTLFDSLAKFDLDVCCLGFDGKKVVAVPRAVRALSSKVNWFDSKVARSIDPTASTVSSRALKYKSRGYSLILPPSSVSYLSTTKQDPSYLSTKLSQIRKDLTNELSRKKISTSDLFGLELLLRKEWNRNNLKEGEQGFKSDYGPIRNSLCKLISGKELNKKENGEISHDYWEWQVKLMKQITEYLGKDDKILKSKKINEFNFASYSIPYVAGYDKDYLYGEKDKPTDAFPQTWTPIKDLQYIVPVPKSLLPLIEKAEKEINEIMNDDDESNNNKRSKNSPPEGPHFTSEEVPSIHQDLVKLQPLNLSIESTTSAESDDLKSFIPHFTGPYSPKNKSTSSSIKLVYPLTNKLSQEIGTTSKASPYVYRILALPSLLQFRGISNRVDQVKDLLYLCYTALARVAVNYPQGIPMNLLMMSESATEGRDYNDEVLTKEMLEKFFNDKYVTKEAKEGLKDFLNQPSKKDVIDGFEKELKWIQNLGQKWSSIEEGGGGGGGESEVGELSQDRKNWLDCYVEGKIMI